MTCFLFRIGHPLMTKSKVFVLWMFLFIQGVVKAQETQVNGRVVDVMSNEGVAGVRVSLENTLFEIKTNVSGVFSFINKELPKGEQVLALEKEGFVKKRFPIVINSEEILDMGLLYMEVDVIEESLQIGTISLEDNELNDEGAALDNISGLLQSSKDVFLKAAAYDFSSTFFKPRGYDSGDGKVLINGIEMNKLYNGRPQWGNWGGLNDVQWNRTFSLGLSANENTFGGLAGTSNMIMRASQYRKGGRISYAVANRSYRGRVMASYNSGLLKKGWSFSFLISRRYGKEGNNEGTVYDANSFFVSVEKELGERQSLNFTAFYTPNRRGKSSANTQEVYDLKGTNYNSYWGYQNGEIRNSRVRKIAEPVLMLNHYWDLSENTQLNTNLAYQFGKIGNSRLGYDNAPNPDPSYYKKLPSYNVANPSGSQFDMAYVNLQKFQQDGQIDWANLYASNKFYDGPARYYLYEDRNDDRQFTVNTILNSRLNEHFTLNAVLRFKNLNSANFANMIDLLGADDYLDLDTFNQGDRAQSDLHNLNRRIGVGEKLKYNYELRANVYGGFVQGQFHYKRFDFYLGGKINKTRYQRQGLYQNGSYPDDSFGKSKVLDFTTFGAKTGVTYKINGQHFLKLNTAYYTKAPTLRNSFSNSRQNNQTVNGIQEEQIFNVDGSYVFRTHSIRARLTGYYTEMNKASDIHFFYADGISGLGRNVTTAFVQEVLTGIQKRHLGGEFGIEAQITPTIKLKGAAALGQYTYANNPKLYLTSDDFEHALDLGKSYLKNYKIAGGPQQAYQIGFEYSDPDYWHIGVTSNFFSHAYVNISPTTRSQNFYLDTDGIPFNDYEQRKTRGLLQQEDFGKYMLLNIVGGKSWKIKKYYLGLFATLNNVLDKTYKTGGYEQGRSANYRTLLEDSQNEPRVFGAKYWYGYGTTFYAHVYVRF